MVVLAGSFVFCISSGLVQMIALMLTSVFVGISITKNHYIFVALEALFVLAVLSVFYSASFGIEGFISAVSQAAIIIMLGCTLGISANIKLHLRTTVLITSTVYLANILMGLWIASEYISYSELLTQIREMTSQLIQTQYGNSTEMLAIAEQSVNEVLTLLYRIMPAYSVIGAGIYGVIITFIFTKLLPKFNKNVQNIEAMSSLRGDKMMGVAFIIICILGFSMQSALMADAFLNVIIILTFAFYIFGISYIDYRMKLKGKSVVGRAAFVVFLIPLATILFIFPALILSMLGFVDCFADFRKKHKKEAEDGPQ